MALLGAMSANREKGKKLITNKFEHHAVLYTAEHLQKNGFDVTFLPVTGSGFVEAGGVEKAIGNGTILASIMHANNEIGTIQPIAEIGKICRERGVLFHTDAVQTVGKEKIDVQKMNIDLLSASGHKFYGPKGIGFLYKKQGIKVEPVYFGGGHEKGLRPGTENVAGIVGMAEALGIALKEMKEENARERKLRNRLIDGCLEIENSWLNGAREPRLSCNAALGFDFVEGESMVLMLSDKGIAASTGSACSSKSLEPSHVLRAIGLPHVKCHGSLRFTLGRGTGAKDIDYVLQVLPGIVERLRKISPLHKVIDISEFEEDIGHKHGHED
jgi:cysteine desulfurase